ncbi:midasin-like [Ostrinia nubilalis]|uniref:midasin-like n=1 Tax=Ostrinia nubilalis TaxID=29057 RepID=UPI0030822C6E
MSFVDIFVALKDVCTKSTLESTAEVEEVLKSLCGSKIELQDAIDRLSDHLVNTTNAEILKEHVSNLLLALVSSKIPLKPIKKSTDHYLDWLVHLDNSYVLAILSDHPDILQYALKYFELNPTPPFSVYGSEIENCPRAPKKRRYISNHRDLTDSQIVTCSYKLLTKLPNEFSIKWDWSVFIHRFSDHYDVGVRRMVKECMVIVTNMTEAQSAALSKKLSIPNEAELKYLSSIDKSRVIPIDEPVKAENLNSVVNIDGIMLPIHDKGQVQKSSLVPVKSTVSNLRSLALAVASGKAVCLLGPVGSGKTSLVEHLAAITGRKQFAFKKVQLGDQTDSRMLLGSHQCTDVPGEFIWRPGVLTEAVQNGHWLLLEDIDSAALDVASTLSSLLERYSLCVPGYRDTLPVTPGFQLFVTQRTLATHAGFQKKMSSSSTLLQKHLTQINVEPLSRSELGEIIQTLYPSLSTISAKIIEVFMMFSVGSHDTSLHSTKQDSQDNETSITVMRGSRLISTRDLIKWCSRSVQDFDVSSPESALKVLQDALDIFTCSVSSPEHRLELAKKIGTCLGIVETKSEFYCKHHKPNVSLTTRALEVGRAKVQRVEKSLESIDLDSKQVVFSFTRQSACLLEKIACCVTSNEPVLLVGETGTGKTSSVQYLARQTGHKLVVINMNQQSDSADLLGGYKPVDMKYVIRPIINEFDGLFRSFYNVEKNQKFLGHIETCYETENWTALLALIKQSYRSAVTRLTNERKEERLKVWQAFGHKLSKLELQVKAASKLTFAFIEGSLVKAMQEGYWVLLDEINLASAEILECLAGLLEDKNESVHLIEKGDKVPIKRHPDFTLFACMNPATDVGKKDLPVGLRNRFTEFFIDELTERNDLMLLIGDYLYHMNLSGATLESIFNFYASIRKEAKLNLVDGSGNAPHYSLRTLCRALTAAAKAKCGTVSRSLYEAFCLSFLTQLDSSSHPKVEAMIAKAVLGKKSVKSILNQLIPEPQVRGQNYLLFEGHWIPQGKLDIDIPEGYILTSTVRKNLRDIARIISLGRLPVLLQGDTSVGKTSLITYIAKASGNYCVRINNHEHTDLQEYIGSYAADANGRLVFKEGVLVEAMRKGYWIILDELNLAPSDVLEALNRVLDDNRELFIPETQQVVKADPSFMLFATQNPPGLYGGRKMLSRAFRNRFVELHFDEIPRNELEIILHQRCHVPPAYSKKMIEVMAELQIRRRGSAAVQGKDSFITLRDLFRWGQRYKQASKEVLTEEKFYDWDQHIADEGYLVLAGKVRQSDERKIIEDVIEKHIKRKVCPDNLFSLHQTTSPVTKAILQTILNNQLVEFAHVVWTYNMRRLGVLIAKAFTFNEPVLLVGETGCGKTTICQVLAALTKRQLLSVNCHMHTESSDFLGGLRPVRQYKNDGRLFEWVDGPLIKAMENGDLFLADEISLADDSVLERMNSLLEPERQLVLSERGMEENSDIVIIVAQENFHFIGTMNPGGDFGKKELSPALRNRFTEIWCDSASSKEDLLRVLENSVNKGISLGNQEDGTSGIGFAILEFTDWLKGSEVTNKFPFSIRDLLSWVQFINVTVVKNLLDAPEAYVHGACMTFLDCFGTALTGHIDSETLILLRENAINFLLKQVGNDYTQTLKDTLSSKHVQLKAEYDGQRFGINPFYIEIGPQMEVSEETEKFTFTAPTTGSNTLRLLRGLQLNKAILLEGNPGVGKTSLVSALAKSSGHKVVRLNLSDQTDITDLFGTDLPNENGSFTFKEGAFLSALQNGDWILLDELNLAPQPVLEGLNACLDHRGEVYIPELGKTFKVKEQTRLFACQNPLKQGGARRGLPVSFLNRFTQVYIDTLTKDDLIYIVEAQYSTLDKDILHRIVNFNCEVAHEITELQCWGHRGSPWEMNLRDIQRWCEAMIEDLKKGKKVSPGKFLDMLYVNRMRTAEDKEKMKSKYDQYFCPKYPRSDSNPQFSIDMDEISIGDVSLERNVEKCFKNRRAMQTSSVLLRSQMSSLKALAQSVNMNWLSILVGPTATGKSTIVQVLADLTANDLHVVPVTSAMDVSDLLGGFEQVDLNRNLENLFDKIETLTVHVLRNIWLNQTANWKSNNLLSHLYEYNKLLNNDNNEMDEMTRFNEKIKFLLRHCKHLVRHTEHSQALTDKLKELEDNLNRLLSKAAKASSVNAGGKFEWVDSLLVKTLIEGSWLLLDNVNLTSSAVLDRLNGLLEPNGVLSIPERGEMCEIKPHPNFRIFFTMDPKYGEISRAMRNRGVEIYLLRPDDWNVTLTDTMPYMDLSALLLSCGLPVKYHKLYLRCHELMESYIQGLERPTIYHLMQAAHLSRQQMIRAVPHDIALLNSFSDVYIKPRSMADFASNCQAPLAKLKNDMLKTIELELQNTKVVDNIEASSTLRVKELCIHSAHELANRLAYSVIQIDAASSFEKTLKNTLYNLFVAYQRCPKEILPALRMVIDRTFNDREEYDYKYKVYSLNFNESIFNSSEAHTLLKTHLRFLPEQCTLNEEAIKRLNESTLILYMQLVASFYINVKPSSEGIKFVDYSRAVRMDQLTDDFSEYPLLRNCLNYIEYIDDCTSKVIKSLQDKLDDETTINILRILNWKYRFLDVAYSCMFLKQDVTRKKRILDLKLVKSIYLHCKWVEKHLFQEMFKMLPSDNEVKKQFHSKVLSFTGVNDQVSAKSAVFGKKLRKLVGQPILYANQSQYELCQTRRTIFKSASINLKQPLERQNQILRLNYNVASDLKLALDVPDEETLNTIIQNSSISSNSDQYKTDASVLPFNACVIQRVLIILKEQIFKVVNDLTADEKKIILRKDFSEVLANLVHFARISKGLAPELLSLLDYLSKLTDGTFDINEVKTSISSLPVRLYDELYKALTHSPAVYPHPFLNVNNDTAPEKVPIDSKRMSINLPLMPYYVQNMTLSKDLEGSHHVLAYETVPLQEHAKYSSQLEIIQNMIWKNMTTLSMAVKYSVDTNLNFELNKFDQLMAHVRKVLPDYDQMCEKLNLLDNAVHLGFEVEDRPIFVDMIHDTLEVCKRLKCISSEVFYDQSVETKVLTAKVALYTSIILVTVMSKMKPTDHVEKYRLKLRYIDEDLNTLDGLLTAYYMQGLVFGNLMDTRQISFSDVTTEMLMGNKDSLKKMHPHCGVIFETREKTLAKISKYAKGNTFRPEDPTYDVFLTDCTHVSKSVLKPKTSSHLALSLKASSDHLLQILQGMPQGQGEFSLSKALKDASHAVQESKLWLYSLNAFYKKLETEYSDAFPDIAKPYLMSISQVENSIMSLNDLVKEMSAKIEAGPNFVETIIKLMKFPNSIPSDTKEKYLVQYLSPTLMQYLLKNKVVNEGESQNGRMEMIELLKMNLSELKMHATALESVDKATINAVQMTLKELVDIWYKEQMDIEKKKQDDEALYVTKSKCEDEDDEVTAQKEIKELFPSFSDVDFGEFKPPTLEQKPVHPTEHTPKQKPLFSSEVISLVYKWHSNFVRNMTRAEWLPIPKKLVCNDVVSPLLQRYPIFGQVVENCWEAIGAEVECILTPSLMVILSQMKEQVDGSASQNTKIDFYRSPWVAETRQCYPLLTMVKDATNTLLDQWPDFPTLKDIIVIIDRILGFPVTSPVSRFLTGLELLRDKIEEWNKNAHKGNNMVEQSLSVGQQIVNWRKLEMGHWKECLNNLYQRKQAEAHKYWFYLFNVIQSHLEQTEDTHDVSCARIVNVLREFMERSSLAEFDVRLDIIYSFHCQLVHLESHDRRDELLAILWNTYNYYAQFRAQVAAHIKEKRAPIEKKLRDFVKICSWDRDLSYWSVKDTVDKAHKALHKHTKEFENILKESVSSCLVDNSTDSGADHVGIWDRPKRITGAAAPAGGAYMIDPQNFVLLTRNVKKYLDQAEQLTAWIAEGSLLSKIPSLVNKAKTLCKDTITNSRYPALVQGLDDFVTAVIETSTHLGSLEADASLPKDKQMSQAKNIVQQKRKALADLFKYLMKMGLNYRSGLLLLSMTENEIYDFTIPPVDVDALMGYLKNRRCDAALSLLWSGCETYFQKNIARHRLLSSALQTPHQDLGLPNIERCKGFTAQLMHLTITQKKSISKYSQYLYDLRTVTTNIENILEIDATDVNITTMEEKITILTECYANCSILLDQFSVLLKSCPEKTYTETEFDLVLSDSPIVRCFKNSDEWNELYKQVKAIIATVTKEKANLLKLQPVPKKFANNKEKSIPTISQAHIDTTKEARNALERIISQIDDILKKYNFTLKYKSAFNLAESPQHPILTSLIELTDYLTGTINKIDDLNQPNKVSNTEDLTDKLISNTKDVVANLLLIIQSVYKKHLPKGKESNELLNEIDDSEKEVEREDSKELLEDNHLRELLHEQIMNDGKLLQLRVLIEKCKGLLCDYVEYVGSTKDVEKGRDTVMRMVPILEQAVLFVQYFVTQKVAVHRVSCKMLSVLLKIFSDLATKGFCKPSDMEEEGDGEGGPGKLSGGTGLGDGEGQKDVSDRIENQDQLEDAHRPGEEKKDEEKDCKEEEKGVNMTDDFDSHLQDVEKKEGEDSNDEDDDEDDPDKQMGETDNAAEKLDQQIWGDEEDLEDDQSKKESEEKGTGESTGEKEMGAKDEEQGTDDGKEGKDKKKKKDINEMDEPEVDDDHVDPYHGNQQQMPEPEDFEMPDNLNLDGEEGEDKEGETETENPFEVDVTKDDIPKDQEESTQDDKSQDEGKGEEHGTEVSSDSEGEENGDGDSQDKSQENEDDTTQTEADTETTQDDGQDGGDEDTSQPEDSDMTQPEDSDMTEPDSAEQDLPRNPDKMDEDEQEESEQKSREDNNPQANPSNDDQSAEDKAENAQMDRGTDDNVETNADQKKDEESAPFEQAQEQVGEDKQSMGRSELDQSDRGHRGEKQAASRADRAQQKRDKHDNKPGKTDQERTLGDVNEKKHKQKTLNVERDEEMEDGGEGQEDDDKDADAYQHVKQAKKDDLQVIDAATKEQADQQPTLQEDEETEETTADDEIPMDVDEEDLQVEKGEELKPEKVKEGSDKQKEKEKSGNKKDGAEENTGETGIEVEGDTVLTTHVPRAADTSFHTRLEESYERSEDMTVEQYMSIREWLTSGARPGPGPAAAWRSLWQEAAPAARALCERLRLVLEPTGRSRRAGDFRTGRAINMRRVIPYIASHFRKDRIWLRRTKPAKREYKIAIAVDDSSSMSDNRSKELAFESLALVSQALNLLESGDLAVLSFGEKPNLLHPFTEQFSEHSGSRILEQLRFEQTKTKVAQLLDFCTVLFEEQTIRSDAMNAKLLVIVSDGRGIFSEGETKVIQAVRRARQMGIFLVYVIIDNPDNKDSIMDIKRPIWDPVTNELSFIQYLDTFPFPFYIILRDMSALPTVLGDALRQWFELAANVAS